MLYLLESEGFIMSEEEIKQAEVKDDINELLPKEEVIEKPTKDSSPYEEVIENARLRFMAKYKVGRRNSYIAMGVFLVLAILSVVFITLQPMGFKIAGWAIIGSTIVGLLFITSSLRTLYQTQPKNTSRL